MGHFTTIRSQWRFITSSYKSVYSLIAITPFFYTMSKIHKQTRQPTDSSNIYCFGCPTEIISTYFDDILQSLVKALPSYIKNTNYYLNKLLCVWVHVKSL